MCKYQSEVDGCVYISSQLYSSSSITLNLVYLTPQHIILLTREAGEHWHLINITKGVVTTNMMMATAHRLKQNNLFFLFAHKKRMVPNRNNNLLIIDELFTVLSLISVSVHLLHSNCTMGTGAIFSFSSSPASPPALTFRYPPPLLFLFYPSHHLQCSPGCCCCCLWWCCCYCWWWWGCWRG